MIESTIHTIYYFSSILSINFLKHVSCSWRLQWCFYFIKSSTISQMSYNTYCWTSCISNQCNTIKIGHMTEDTLIVLCLQRCFFFLTHSFVVFLLVYSCNIFILLIYSYNFITLHIIRSNLTASIFSIFCVCWLPIIVQGSNGLGLDLDESVSSE